MANELKLTTNYIYLLQEREFIKTNEKIYKVGRTTQENSKRFKGYPKGSVLLFQMICQDCKSLEGKIIEHFKEKFNQRRDIGTEYFEGDYTIMIDMIYTLIKSELILIQSVIVDEIKSEIDDAELEIDEHKKYELLCQKIAEIFPDYKNDESFGGIKKYIKIELNSIHNQVMIYYLNPRIGKKFGGIWQYDTEIDDYICIFSVGISSYEYNYIERLVCQNIIAFDKIYDIYSINFINKLNKTKLNILIENCDDICENIDDQHYTRYYCEIYTNTREKIRQLLMCNTIVNNKLYFNMLDKEHDVFKEFGKLKCFDDIVIDIGIHEYVTIRIYKINNKYYDYKTYLRKYIPYQIRWDMDNNYYILNRNYEYIGSGLKYIDHTCGGQSYLFNDGCAPWHGKEYFIRMCEKYKEIIQTNKLKKCVNPNKSTEDILMLV